ncbi:hypothetical protein IFT72_11235 [Frigoribacterium sp. CFBP 8754]|uniref:hypothetical protein n=1 Tax=Frigoribacterium sp. CFBP 8754 TaxID=2775290 RepID=UPI001784A3CE|nr:hypothetical protein [Frigoribacterium sp. CFBP 8754]
MKTLSVSSIPGTDILIDPGGDDGGQVTSSTLHDAATLLTDAPAGDFWMLIRAFSLPKGDEPVEVGLEAQSPQSEGCDVVFEEPCLVEKTISDFRDES